MSASSDISGLFKWFGGRPEHYQEMPHDDLPYTDREPPLHLPAEVVVNIAEHDAPELPEQEPLEQVCKPLLAYASLDECVGKSSGSLPAENEEEVWSSAGLQGLLAKLAQDDQSPLAGNDAASVGSLLERISVVAIVSAKGGVGKTTLSATLAAALYRAGRPVLAVDMDPQNALQHHFKAVTDSGKKTVTGIGYGERDWYACGVPSHSGVLVLPYGDVDEQQRLSIEQQMSSTSDWLARRLAEMDLSDGTIVVIDTPPGPSIYLRQALSVANEAVVVSLADAASYTSLPKIDSLIKTYTAGRDHFMGTSYLINQVDETRQLSRDITRILGELLGVRVLGLVHHDPSIGDALAYNHNILEYDPRSQASGDILSCSSALFARLAAKSSTREQ